LILSPSRLDPPKMAPVSAQALAASSALVGPTLRASEQTSTAAFLLLQALTSDFQFSKVHTPEFQIGRHELYPQIPTVRPLHTFPDDDRFLCLSRGQIRHPQPLLQVEFPWTHQKAAVGIDDASKACFKMERTLPTVPFD
jgi:hypothetical protein